MSKTIPATRIPSRRFPLSLTLVLSVAVSACSVHKPRAVPMQPGKSVQEARDDLSSCARRAPEAGRKAVVANYAASPIWGGLVLGPLVIAAREKEVRKNGERRAVDRCLEQRGYQRRELTPEEEEFLNRGDTHQREFFLQHLMEGGTLESFKADYVVQ